MRDLGLPTIHWDRQLDKVIIFNKIQLLINQILTKQIRITQDIPTFLFIYTQDGLKSSNNRLRIKSIQLLNDLLTSNHQYENLSPILEILLQYLRLLRSIQFQFGIPLAVSCWKLQCLNYAFLQNV